MRGPAVNGRSAVTALVGIALLLMSACGSGPDTSSTTGGSAPEESVTLTVAAAASLTDALTEVGDAFTAANPGVSLRYSFAGSSTIAQQIRQGAPIDVFVSAGTTSMDPVASEGLVIDVADIATNALQIATPPGNRAGVTGLADLERVSVVVCDVEVPCGVAATRLFEQSDLSVQPVSLEPDVRAVLTKVATDEVDAGIVYVTDVRAAGDAVVGIAIPPEANVSTSYQAGVVAESAARDAARAYVSFLTSPAAQAILAAAGFGPP